MTASVSSSVELFVDFLRTFPIIFAVPIDLEKKGLTYKCSCKGNLQSWSRKNMGGTGGRRRNIWVLRQDSHPTRPFPHGALSSVLNGRNFFRMSERDGKATGGGRNRLKCALLYCNVHSKQFSRSPLQMSHYPHCQIHQALTPFILSSISGFLGTNKATKTLNCVIGLIVV